MSKYIGKFRKNEDYKDDYESDNLYFRKKSKNEHSRIKKMKIREYQEVIRGYKEENKMFDK